MPSLPLICFTICPHTGGLISIECDGKIVSYTLPFPGCTSESVKPAAELLNKRLGVTPEEVERARHLYLVFEAA